MSVKSQACFFKRTQKKLIGRGEKRKCSPVRFHLCLDFRYLIYIEKKPSFFNFVPRASQLPSLFLTISYTIDVILLDIANVFQILISASWFWRNSRGIWVILILFCWNHRILKWSVGFSLDSCSISHRAFSLTWRTSTPIYWKKESVYIRKEFNSHKIGLEHQHGRRFFFLEQQYGRRDVMWKRKIKLRGQQNWAVVEFKEDCFGERFCDFWKSVGWKLRVFCTFRRAWPHQRN